MISQPFALSIDAKPANSNTSIASTTTASVRASLKRGGPVRSARGRAEPRRLLRRFAQVT